MRAPGFLTALRAQPTAHEPRRTNRRRSENSPLQQCAAKARQASPLNRLAGNARVATATSAQASPLSSRLRVSFRAATGGAVGRKGTNRTVVRLVVVEGLVLLPEVTASGDFDRIEHGSEDAGIDAGQEPMSALQL